MTTKNDNLPDRIKNPNKDFDALVWRPKSRFWRKFMAKYVNYVEIAGYLFVIAIITAVIFTWVKPSSITTQAKDTPPMKPVVSAVKSPSSAIIEEVRFTNGSSVKAGDTLFIIQDSSKTKIPLLAPAAGYAYVRQGKKGFDSLLQVSVKAGEEIGNVVDFSQFIIECEFSKYGDSINLGDSAKIAPISHHATKKSGLIKVVMKITQDKKEKISRLNYMVPNALLDSLNESVKGAEYIIKNAGYYKISDVKEGSMIFDYDGEVIANDESEISNLATMEPIWGVLDSGIKTMELELAERLPVSTKVFVDNWGKTFEGEKIKVDNTTTKTVKMTDNLIKLKIGLEAPLTKELVNYMQFPDSVKSKAIEGTDVKVKGIIKVTNAPEYIQKIAKKLYEDTPKSQYLVAKVDLRAYKTTWGRRLLKA